MLTEEEALKALQTGGSIHSALHKVMHLLYNPNEGELSTIFEVSNKVMLNEGVSYPYQMTEFEARVARWAVKEILHQLQLSILDT